MTVPINDRRIQYTATAAQVTFPYDFRIDSEDDIEVKQTVKLTGLTNILTVTTDFTVTNVEVDGGGDIVLNVGAAVDDVITITGKTPLSRVTDFDQAGDYFADEVNKQFDKITRILQENDTATRRALLLADEDTVDSLELPITEDRKSKFLSFDTNGDPIATEGSVDGVPVSAFMATLLDDTTAEEGRATLNAQEDVITTRGDIVRGDGLGNVERLGLGAVNYLLKSDGNDISWGFEVLDEDDMSSNSETKLATQQSIKTYSDSVKKVFSVSRGSSQTIGSGIVTKVQFDVKDSDPDGEYDNSTNYRYTPQKAGWYLIILQCAFDNISTGNNSVEIQKNGNAVGNNNQQQNSDVFVRCSILVNMNGTTDYIEGYVTHTSGSNRNLRQPTYMQGIFIGE